MLCSDSLRCGRGSAIRLRGDIELTFPGLVTLPSLITSVTEGPMGAFKLSAHQGDNKPGAAQEQQQEEKYISIRCVRNTEYCRACVSGPCCLSLFGKAERLMALSDHSLVGLPEPGY